MITTLTGLQISNIANYLNINNVRRKALYNALENTYMDFIAVIGYSDIIKDIQTERLRFAISELPNNTNISKGFLYYFDGDYERISYII